ncbi:MAG: membrane dipeptidase [Ignavibacteriales bacterium]|nr:membrane dipeptidase [Ignavibacteriales bacterium]
MKKIYFLLLLLISASNIIYSQSVTLSGKVTDKSESTPIQSAAVDIINKNNPLEKYSTLTDGYGEWKYIFQPSDVSGGFDKPSTIHLSQNYPNPFNPSTKIDFSLNQPGQVRFTAYSILGEQIDSKTFFLSEGNFSINWFSQGSAGVVIYSIEMNNTVVSKKMVQLDGGGNGGWGSVNSSNNSATVHSMPKITTEEFYVIAYKLGYEPDTITVTPVNNEQINFDLETVHNNAFVIDLHNDVLEKLIVDGYDLASDLSNSPPNDNDKYQSDLPRFRKGGVDAQMFALWADVGSQPSGGYQETIDMINLFQTQISKNQSIFTQAKNSSEIKQAMVNKKLAGILAIEGGNIIENDLEKLKTLYSKGIRYLTITWNNSTNWAVSAKDAQSATKGLTEFGKSVIRMMDSLGIIIDVSHTGKKTIDDILIITKNPIIASHSGVWNLNHHYRNLTDNQIINIAKSGGIIGVVFYTSFLSKFRSVNIDTVIKHIDYIKNLVGVDYISLGSDFDGGIDAPDGLEDVSKFPNLTLALLKHGYTIPEVKKILGENYLRVFKKVCDK